MRCQSSPWKTFRARMHCIVPDPGCAYRLAYLTSAILAVLILIPGMALESASAETREEIIRLAQTDSPEVSFWESVRDSDDPDEVEAYIEAYPNGKFVPLARIRLKKLKRNGSPTDQPASTGQPAATKTEAESAQPKTVPQSNARIAPGRQIISAKVGEMAGTKRGSLGVRIGTISKELADGLGLTSTRGAMVTSVVKNSAAEQAGIKALDVILEFDGQEIATMWVLPQIVGATRPGTEVRISIFRLAPDIKKFLADLRARAESGDGAAASSLGTLHATGAGLAKNETEAVRWHRKGAELGFAEAMYRLGVAYANGQGVSKDETEAVAWYQKSSDKGNADATAVLGIMHADGRGVAKDEGKAARLYRKAAEQGSARAMYQLGAAYADGKGVAKDDAEAVIWYQRAADENYADGIANLGFMYEKGRGIFNDDAKALRLYTKAASLNHSGAMNQLGIMYAEGRGTSKDEIAAVAWYRRAATLGHVDATTALGWMYQTGRGVTQNDKEALRNYRLAAEKGHTGATSQIGWMYTNGRGVKKDPKQAITWYRKAADRGHSDAMYSLGRAYENGTGTSRDRSQAADWLFKALKAKHAFTLKEMTTNYGAWSKEFRRELQQRLKDAGAYHGSIDGSFGPATLEALKTLAK
jgi:TPR repeat protein